MSTPITKVRIPKSIKKKSRRKDVEIEAELSKQHYVSSIDKLILFKEFKQHFLEWVPWQRRLFICRCMEKCSVQFLSTLATIIEPVYHRDFDIIRSKDGFQSSLIKNFVNAVEQKRLHETIPAGKTKSFQKLLTCQTFTVRRTKSPFDDVPLKLPLITDLQHHKHLVNRTTDSLSTIDFVPEAKKATITTRAKVKSSSLDRKFWLPQINNVQVDNGTSKRGLLHIFNTACNNFIQKFLTWKNAEKGDFIMNLANLCTAEDLHFLANCISDRLKTTGDINRLPDKVLLHIFSYLKCNELRIVPQVCKGWKHLSSVSYLWRSKCYQHLRKHNETNLFEYLDSLPTESDWKIVYSELTDSLKRKNLHKKHSHEVFQVVPESQLLINYEVYSVTQPKANDNQSDSLETSVSLHDTQHKDDISGVPSNLIDVVENIPCLKISSGSIQQNIEDVSELVKSREDFQEKRKHYDEEDVDVAFDVRGKLVQAQNYVNGNTEKDDDKVEYAQVPITGINSLKRVRKLQGHLESVLCVQFDAKRVMTGSADRTVRLWDVRSGRNFYKLKGHLGGVRSIYFDDRYIVTGSWDTTVMIWDVVNFTVMHVIIDHKGCVSCLEMDEDKLVTGSHDCKIRIFRKHSWDLIQSLSGHLAPITCIVLVSDTEVISGALDKNIILWDIKIGSILRKFEGISSGIHSVKLCGALLATGSTDGKVTFWNYDTGLMEGVIKAHDGPVNALCFVGARFITGGGDNLVKEWDILTCTCLRSLSGHKGAINCVRASSKRIISGSADGTVRVWDFVSNFKQTGGPYDEVNNVIASQVVNENQYKNLNAV